MQQGHHDAGTGGTDRVADGDRAAVRIDAVRVERQVLEAGHHLAGKGLVELDLVDVGTGETLAPEQPAHGGHRADAHDAGFNTDHFPIEQPAGDGQSEALGLGFGSDQQGGGAVGDARSVAGRDPAAVAENRLELHQAFEADAVARVFVLFDPRFLFAVRDDQRRDLPGEASGFAGRFAAALAGESPLVRGFAGDVPILRQLFRRFAHHQARKGIVETVAVHAVDDFRRTHPVTPAGARQEVGGIRHTFGTTHQRHPGFAELDGAGRRKQGLKARAAGLVDGEGGTLHRQTGAVGDLAGRIGTAAGLAAMAENRLVDQFAADARPFEAGTGSGRTEVGGG